MSNYYDTQDTHITKGIRIKNSLMANTYIGTQPGLSIV